MFLSQEIKIASKIAQTQTQECHMVSFRLEAQNEVYIILSYFLFGIKQQQKTLQWRF